MLRRLLRSSGFAGVLLCGGLLGGCASGPHANATSYMVKPGQAEFFKYGPAQAYGPDQSLKRGERVTLVQRQFGYSRVALADGTTGFMATEDLVPAPPLPSAARPSLALFGARNSTGAHPASKVMPTNDPLFDLNDTPLQGGEPERPTPRFRY